MNEKFNLFVADKRHTDFAETISVEMELAAKKRGTGIAKRSAEYLIEKMMEGKAVVALTEDGRWAGFCYIESWSHGKYVANSGLIVAPEYRLSGLAKEIKQKIFELSRTKYPEAKLFGLTTGLAVMKINSDLGYEPVTYSELTQDEEFWAGCKSCVNYEILMSKERKNCMCTAMLYDPADHFKPEETASDFKKQSKVYERFMRIKQSRLLKFLTGKQSSDKKKSFFSQLLNL